MSFLLHFSSYLIGGNVPIDDGVDKLNRKYTILILVCLSLPLVTKQFAGDPIECFTPTYFTEPQARYVNSYCWTASTYYIIPVDEEEKQMVTRVHSVTFEEGGPTKVKGERIKVNYYQWAPIILLVEAGLFYVPFAIWNATAKNSGIKVGRLLKKVSVISQYTPGHPDRDALIAEFLDQFNTLMGVAKCCPGTVCKFDCNVSTCGGAPSSSLFVLYMFIKLLYVLNIISQYFLLSLFLGEGYLYHGVEVLEKLINKKEWWTSPRFPLQTLCQVLAAQQGSLRTYTCQCVLPINLFNEKIFSFVWFFFAILLPVTIYSGLIWLWRTLACSRIAFIHYYLWRTRRIGKEDLYNNARKMAVDYLGWDGCLVLRLVEMNHGGTILTTLTERLWEFYEGLETAQQDGGDPEAFINQRQPMYACGPIQPPGGASVPNTQAGPYRFYSKHFIPGAPAAYPGYMWNHSEMASPSYSSFPRIRGKIRTEDLCDVTGALPPSFAARARRRRSSDHKKTPFCGEPSSTSNSTSADGATEASALTCTSSFTVVSSYHCAGAETVTACVNSSSVTSADIPSDEIYVFSARTPATSPTTSQVKLSKDFPDAPAFNSPLTKRNPICYTPLATSTNTFSSPLSRSSDQCQTTNTESFSLSVLTPLVQPLNNATRISSNLVSSLSTNKSSNYNELGSAPAIQVSGSSRSSKCRIGKDEDTKVSCEVIYANTVDIPQGMMFKNPPEVISVQGSESRLNPDRCRGLPTVEASTSERNITKSILIEPKNLFTRKPQLKYKNRENPASCDFLEQFSSKGIRSSGTTSKIQPSQDSCPSVGRENKMVHLNNSKCDIFDISSGTRSKRGNTLSLSVPANVVEEGGHTPPQGTKKSSPKEQVRLKDTNLRVADLRHIDELSSKEVDEKRNKDIEDNKKYLYFTTKV